MTEAWLDFSVVVLVQLLLFLVHAHYEKRMAETPRILARGILIGIFFGVFFDLLVGKVFGLYTYTLGFGLGFLTINGALSYGFMQANALLMERARFFHFYVWTIVVGIVYEMTNFFFPVWSWEFGSPITELIVVHAFGYIGLAILMALTWHLFLGHKFTFIENLLKQR
ncbi:MAG: hypothetical protein AAB545_02330 [Patescibacteria group bacterium]